MAELRPYEPTLRERLAQFLLGDERPSPERERIVSGLLGTRGLGDRSMSLADVGPAGVVFSVEDAARAYGDENYAGAATNAASAVLGAIPFVANAVKPLKNLASRSANIYTPPSKPARDFALDYPKGALADDAGNLTHTIDGQPITAKHVVGRTQVGGSDVALPSEALDEIAKAGTGKGIAAVPASALPRGDVGNVAVNRYSRLPTEVAVYDKLNPAQFDKVSRHEIGHVIDQIAGEIPTTGLSKELAQVYNTLNTGVEKTTKLMGPQHIGYKEADVPREYLAEAIRAYLTDPNYLKAEAPKTAAAIRKAVNGNAQINKTVQFNSVAPAGAVVAGGAVALRPADVEAREMAGIPDGFEIDQPQGLPDGFSLDGQQEQGPPMPQVGFGEALGRGAVQGATLGFADEIGGLEAASPFTAGRQENTRLASQDIGFSLPNVTSPVDIAIGGGRMLLEKLAPKLFGRKGTQAYNQYVGTERAANAMAADQRPYATIAGNFAGGVALPIGAVKSVTQGMKVGAGLGAVSGFGSGEGLTDSVAGAGKGALLGAGIGAIAGKLVGGKPPPSAPPTVSPVGQAADDLGVTLTAGQKTGDVRLLSREDKAFGGAFGEGAQRAAQEANAARDAQIAAARGNISDTLSPNVPGVDAPAVVHGTLRNKASAAKANATALYDAAYSAPGEFNPQALTGVGKRIEQSLINRAQPIIPDANVTPNAARAIKILDDVQNLRLGAIGQPKPGNTITGISMQGVDQARRKLQAVARAAQPGTEDARAVSAIISEFDQQIESAVMNGLFSGSNNVVKTLQDARKAYSSYVKTFRPGKSGDDAGKAIQSIIEDGRTPQEVANYLYGAAASGVGDGRSTRLAGKLKDVLGETSDEWQAIRAGAWERLVSKPEGVSQYGPTQVANRIYSFINGRGGSMAGELFSADEIATMAKYADVLKATAMKPGAVNTSQSGNKLIGAMTSAAPAAGAAIGSLVGGPMGAATGAGIGRVATSINQAMATKEAQRLFSGQVPEISRPLSETLAAGMANIGGKLPRIVAPAEKYLPNPLGGSRLSYGQPNQEENNARR